MYKTLRIIIIIFLLGLNIQSLTLKSYAFNQSDNSQINLIIVAGQSNAVGAGTIGAVDLSQTYLSSISSTLKFNYKIWPTDYAGNWIFNSNNQWDNLEPKVFPALSNINSTIFGPELSLGKSLSEHGLSNTYVLKIAANGTSLYNNWNPASGYLYASLVESVNSAIAELIADGKTINLQGFYWLQGESDAFEGHQNDYQLNLTNFINAVRNDLSSPTLPFYINEASNLNPETAIIRQAQANIASSIENTYLISSDMLPRSDLWHYDLSGQITLGQNLANMSIPRLSFSIDRNGLRPNQNNGQLKFRLSNTSTRKSESGSELEFSLPNNVTYNGFVGNDWSCQSGIVIYSGALGIRCTYNAEVSKNTPSSELQINLFSDAAVDSLLEFKLRNAFFADQDDRDNIIQYRLNNGAING